MLLKAFQISNYKSFVESGKCSVQTGVTILAGQNESGKTNILSALSKINEKSPVFSPDEYSFDQTVSPEIKYWFKLSEQELNEIQGIVSGGSVDQEILVTVTNAKREIACQYTYDGDPTEEDPFRKKLFDQLEGMLPKFVLYKSLTDDIPDTFTAKDVSTLPVKRLSTYLNADFAKIFTETSQQRQRNATLRLSRNISDDFSAKYRQKEVRLEFDINKDIISFYVRDKKPGTDEYGYAFQLKQRSTGLRWYLNFYIALKGEDLKPGDIILVDEPGMYLHPKAQQEMREILNEESGNNQIIYTTHSPYLIDADNVGQVRLVEKSGIDSDDGYNEISEIKERIHHSGNTDTLKPILDAIGYSLGSELNLQHQKILICEGVSDYYYVKALEVLCGTPLECGITHANGCNNIWKIASLFLGLGIPEIFVLVDSDGAGVKERAKLIGEGIIEETHAITTHGQTVADRAIEDIFNREWYLREIFGYTEDEIRKADAVLSKEMKKKHGGAKYVWAKKAYEAIRGESLSLDNVLNADGQALINELIAAINAGSHTENN